MREGYSIDSSVNNSSLPFEHSFLIEIHCFRFTLNVDEVQLSQTFKNDIDKLPHFYNYYNKHNFNTWKKFFDKYGTYVIQSAWAGGRCSVTIKSSNMSTQHIELIKSEVLTRISNHEAKIEFKNKIVELKNIEEAINAASLRTSGGDVKYHAKTFQEFNGERWLSSIKVKPDVLDTKLKLIPINIIAGKYKNQIREPMEAAIRDLLGAELTYISPAIMTIVPPKSREEATNCSANKPDGTCLRSGTLMSMANGTKLAVEKLNPGDLVVGKNGMPCQVLGRNEVLLGSRSLYGFSSEHSAFFTSEHLFATQNDEWMCIDPDISQLINPQNSKKKIHRMQDQCNILRWNGKTTELVKFNVFKSTEKFFPTMKVHCLLVTNGIYVANDYITHDSMPNLLAWPTVAICLASLAFSESAYQLFEYFNTIDSLDDANHIRELSYQISTEWKKIIKVSTFHTNFNDIEKVVKLAIEKFKYLAHGDQCFLQEIISKPALTFLSQNLFILCGEDLHEALDVFFRENEENFYCKAALLFKTADSIITQYMKKLSK
ncbi:GTP-binding protein A [Gigaspora margarita]|uniref:GTP-binding protein A n=2 Tax=Gigaspora margarita TaxID=4874 RepID=A0A8H4AZV2_GIGMA|nr:GTP-binding protein A [Gigaspora margarita]